MTSDSSYSTITAIVTIQDCPLGDLKDLIYYLSKQNMFFTIQMSNSSQPTVTEET